NRVDDGPLVDRVREEVPVQGRVTPHPQAVGDRIGHEGQEYREIGHHEGDGPRVLAALEAAAQRAKQRVSPQRGTTDLRDRYAGHGADPLRRWGTWRTSRRSA